MPFDDNSFDVVTCVVSVDYLIKVWSSQQALLHFIKMLVARAIASPVSLCDGQVIS